MRAHVGWRDTGTHGLRRHQGRRVGRDGHERVPCLWRATDDRDGNGVCPWITRLDPGRVIVLGPGVMRMRAGQVQVRGDTVPVVLVVVTGERMHVPRQRRREGQHHGDSHESGEHAVHGPECTALPEGRQFGGAGRQRASALWGVQVL